MAVFQQLMCHESRKKILFTNVFRLFLQNMLQIVSFRKPITYHCFWLQTCHSTGLKTSKSIQFYNAKKKKKTAT